MQTVLCQVWHPTKASVCTKPDGHKPSEHTDAFGNVWPARDNEPRLNIPLTDPAA